MRGLIDYHLHTNATEDAENTIEQMAGAAAERGLSEIMITDHYIIDEPGYRVSPKRLEQHFKAAESLSEKYGLKVLIGLEMDYFEEHEDRLRKVLDSFDFDMVTGAAHYVDGLGLAFEPHTIRLFEKYPPAECYRKSFDNAAKAAASGMFDVIAHMDIVMKYSIRRWGEVPFDEYAESFGALLAAMKKTGTGFEVNCRGFDHQPGRQYPSAMLMEKLLAAGVDTVTLGSDSHCVDLVGEDLGRGFQALRQAGGSHLTTFRKRARTNIPLSEFSVE